MNRQFLLYCICGGIGVSTDYVTFYVIFSLFDNYQIANATGYLTGTLISFALNRQFTFQSRDKVFQRLALFILVAMIGYGFSALALLILVDHLSMDARIAKLLTLPGVVVLQYTLNRWITFRQNAKLSQAD